MGERDDYSVARRSMLALLGTGSAAALAGCLGGDSSSGDDDDDSTPTQPATPTATVEEVPEAYRTATALNGDTRDPDALSAQPDVNYQSEPRSGQQCSGCAFYIPDKNDDGVGACSVVEGTIEPNGYCVSYVAYEDDGGGDSQAVDPVDVPEDATCSVCEMNAAKFPEWNAQAVHGDDSRAFFCTAGCATTYYAATGEFADTDADITGLWVRDMDSRELVDGTTAYYALETDPERFDDPMRLNPAPFADRDAAVSYVEASDALDESDIVELSAFDRDLASQYRGSLLE